jgi:hypothetical protein
MKKAPIAKTVITVRTVAIMVSAEFEAVSLTAY